MTHFLFLFLDGVGLGTADPSVNPFASARMPNLETLLSGRCLVNGDDLPYETSRSSLLSLDANLGVAGLPQSATGQAVLLTGINIPEKIGFHYGPKPNPEVATFLKNGNLFHKLVERGRICKLLSGYPPRYFEAVRSGRRIYSAIPLAASSAGLELMGFENIRLGQALPADLTGAGWRQQAGFPEIPELTPYQAGERLGKLGMQYDFALFEYWLTDYAGHEQNLEQAVKLLETLDEVLGGLFDTWDDDQGLLLITSDHGNLEDLSTRRHTANPVPGLVVGSSGLRQQFCTGLRDLTGITGRILDLY
jgi:hypothetical protein